ncbi:MAG TPA: NAD-dependent epimerase/dehydratase family protein [Ktedonobacteraceae bacterium]
MRILVIGGTSFMGPYIIRNLSAAGHEVSIFHRGQTKAELPEGVRELLGDRDHLPDYASEFKKLAPEVVLDMVVWHEQHARDLMATCAGVARRVVMISSMDVYRAFGRVNGIEGGDIEPPPLTEESPLRTKLYPYRGETPRAEDDPKRWYDDYDKIPAEQVVMSHPELPGTVLRLPAVYGPHDGQHRMFLYLKHMLDERPAILMEEDVAHWRWTWGYVENVADAIALAVTSEQASGRIYNVGEPFAHSQHEQVERIAKIVGWHGHIATLPTERVPEGLREGINAAQHIIADTSRIRQELGYSERIEPAEALRRTLAWEKDNPPTKINPAQFDYAAEDQALADLAQ